MRLVRALAFLCALFAVAPAFAQSTVLQGGPTTPAHVPIYSDSGFTQPIIQDGGGSGGVSSNGFGNPSELGITSRSPSNTYPSASSGNGPLGEHYCMFDAPTTNPTGYHYICFDPNAQGGGLIDYGAAGAAAQLPLSVSLNGVKYPFPFVTTGVVGPSTTVINDVACWNNTVGTLLKDCGGPLGTLAFTVAGSGVATAAALGVNTTGGFVTYPISPSGLVLGSGVAAALAQSANGASGLAVLDSNSRATSFPVQATGAAGARTLGAMASDAFNVKNEGASGAGTGNDGPYVQDALTQAASGGEVDLPCGVYKITQNLAVTIANLSHLKVQGGGSDCTELWFSGAYGMTVNWANTFASVDFSGLSITTDQTGATTGLTLSITAPYNGVNEFGSNNFYDVVFRGHDRYSNPSTTVEYWGTAFYNNGVSNINFWGGTCDNPQYVNPGNGICYSLNGPSNSIQSVVVNFYGTVANFCSVAWFYGQETQGVSLTAVNTVGCGYSVETTSSTDGPAQLSITQSQFNNTICGVCIEDPAFDTLQISNSVFNMAPGSIGIQVEGTGHTIVGNTLSHAGSASGTGILIAGSSANSAGSIIANNQIGNWTDGIKVNDGVTSYAYANYNNMVSNTSDYTLGGGYGFWTTSHAYTVGTKIITNVASNLYIYTETAATCTSAGSGSGPAGTGTGISDGSCTWNYVSIAAQAFFINDNEPRNLSNFLPCGQQLKRSSFIQADSNITNGYGGVATGGGGQVIQTHCDGSAWRNG